MEGAQNGNGRSGEHWSATHGLSELMKERVHNILLVSSLYDAFILEEEGLLMDQISGDYREFSLTASPPSIKRVDTCELALAELGRKRYDLVITMPRIADMEPFEFGRRAKAIQVGVPVILLLTDAADIPAFHRPGVHMDIDNVFYWSGDSSLMFAVTKYAEDLLNVDRDTKNGFVRVLLIVEDSPRYYSMFLPIVYREIMRQTQELISEGLNEHEKTFRKRARPKIVLAETYEDAMRKYSRYRENILGVITDVKYPMNGREDEEAGFRLVEEIDDGIPVLVQSTDERHREKARALGAEFIGKKSDKLLRDLERFFKESLGFGDFVFRTPDGRSLGAARDLTEFMRLLESVPEESIRYHAGANHFSNWLMARGEVGMAMKLRPKKVSDFGGMEEIRRYLADSFRELDRAKRRGVITDFAQQNFEVEETFTRLGGGSLGGKGRGLAFLFALFVEEDIDARIPQCRVRIPDTLVMGTDVFDRFMEDNGMASSVLPGMSDGDIKAAFLKGSLPEDIVKALGEYLAHVTGPVAVRSSSLLEDSANQPFAGIYSTYMLPNNCADAGVRLAQLCDAIKLVYASVFFRSARAYIESTLHTAEEEKMAIVLQKMVGNRHGDRFYPLCSGVAQSYNFYPVAPLAREDGIASIALGLGNIVVDGGKTLSVSPAHPDRLLGFSTPEQAMRNSQSEFYALNMRDMCFDISKGERVTLEALPVGEAEPDGTLEHITSTYDLDDGVLRDGHAGKGPKVITFAGMLKYGQLPLLDVIRPMLEIGTRGMGGHVETEFAMMFDPQGRPEFYVVQIRPLTSLKGRNLVSVEPSLRESSLVFSSRALGNGTLSGIRDVVYIDPACFDKTMTGEMAAEIGRVNAELRRPYLLIGPGRWGTQDRFLGVPVTWDSISHAKAMVEVGLQDFRIDPSHGTHFFHNITSLGIMYFTVPYGAADASMRWDWLAGEKPAWKGRFVTHVQLGYELEIRVDGRSGRGTVRRSN